MDQIVAIFNQLGVDSSIYYQFIVFLVLFNILNVTLFSKLQFVLETREGKTTKLDEVADGKLKEFENLMANYNLRIKEANEKAQEIMSNNRQEVLKEGKARFKKFEEQIVNESDEKRKVIEQELEQLKAEVLKSSDNLSKELVEKIVQ